MAVRAVTIDANGNARPDPVEASPGDEVKWNNQVSKQAWELEFAADCPLVTCKFEVPAGESTTVAIKGDAQPGRNKYSIKGGNINNDPMLVIL